MINYSFTTSLPKKGVVVLPIYEAEKSYSCCFDFLNQITHGALANAIAQRSFTGKKSQFIELVSPRGLEKSTILLFGCGKKSNLTLLDLEAIGGEAFSIAQKIGNQQLCFMLDSFIHDDFLEYSISNHILLGAQLKAYRFDRYKTQEKADLKNKVNMIKLMAKNPEFCKNSFHRFHALIEGVYLARDLSNEPANVLNPEEFAKRCNQTSDLGVRVEVLDEIKMQELGLNALLAVGQGSTFKSQLVIMHWEGDKNESSNPICIIGKGVCFDSGGISIKGHEGMWHMKWDMGSAGAITGLMHTLAKSQSASNVIGIIGLVENMPDGNAQRPGDVVTSLSGKTIEVINTDAEGRLVLADAISYTQNKYHPRELIDVATLTGAVITALAHEYAGAFTNNTEQYQNLKTAGCESGEQIWRLPLTPNYRKELNSKIADIKNISNTAGAASVAAAFIEEFVDQSIPWTHIDIASTGWNRSDKPTGDKGASGFGVRLLEQYIHNAHKVKGAK